RGHLDPGNRRCGRNTLGVGVGRPLQEPATPANHRHGLAQDKSPGETAPANFRNGLSRGRRGAQTARARLLIARSPNLNAVARVEALQTLVRPVMTVRV